MTKELITKQREVRTACHNLLMECGVRGLLNELAYVLRHSSVPILYDIINEPNNKIPIDLDDLETCADNLQDSMF
jgi:hypothetical protein